jgi:hypothetical protein
VHNGTADENSPRRGRSRQYTLLAALLITGLGPASLAAHAVKTHAHKTTSHTQSADTLSIQINNDRMTLAITRVPQVYLYGVIDADAPQRFEALVKSGKIPAESDIYLNSAGGDLRAGLALGRLFRTGSMVTHLGTPRRSGRSRSAIKTAVCTDACIYTYLGGLYRWAPTGSDRIGLPATEPKEHDASHAPPGPDEIVSYLKEMGIDPAALATASATSPGNAAWLSADQMMSAGLANNGRLPLTVKYQMSPPAPYLVLNQIDRHGQHRLTIECKPGGVTLTAVDLVGAARAREIVAHGTRSYFEINRQETLTQPRDGASVANESVMIVRSYPATQLGHLLYARSVGAWIGGRTNAFRYGFTFELEPVRSALKDYYQACWRAAPWPVK